MTSQRKRSNHRNEATVRQAQTGAMHGQNQHRTELQPHSTLDQLNQIDAQETEEEIRVEEVDADSKDLNAIAADDAADELGDGVDSALKNSELPEK